jgi:hypothetical protein
MTPEEHFQAAVNAELSKRVRARVCRSKAELRAGNRHQGGARQFGYQLGELNADGKSRALIPDPAEQEAIADMIVMDEAGHSLMKIRDTIRARGFKISGRPAPSHQTVRRILAEAKGKPLKPKSKPIRSPLAVHAAPALDSTLQTALDSALKAVAEVRRLLEAYHGDMPVQLKRGIDQALAPLNREVAEVKEVVGHVRRHQVSSLQDRGVIDPTPPTPGTRKRPLGK